MPFFMLSLHADKFASSKGQETRLVGLTFSNSKSSLFDKVSSSSCLFAKRKNSCSWMVEL